MRTTAALLLTLSLSAAAADRAAAQDAPKETASETAEDAFLKAYFSEKELKDPAAAEKAYAALVESPSAQGSREVVARAFVGRARCLRALKRDAEADAALARVEKEFADLPKVADEAKAARSATSIPPGGSVEGLLRAAISMSDWQVQAPRYGDRGIPVLVRMLQDDQPEVVERAAGTLGLIGTPAAVEAVVKAIEERSSTYPAQVEDFVIGELPEGALLRLARSPRPELRTKALSHFVFVRETGSTAPFELIAGDAALRESFLGGGGGVGRDAGGYGRLLGVALAAGGDARAAALARIDKLARPADTAWNQTTTTLLDPPAAVLRDAEALRAVWGLWKRTDGTFAPPATFVAACLSLPETEKIGVDLAIRWVLPEFDPDRFVDALARAGQPPEDDPKKFGRTLAQAVGDRPPPERLRRVAAAWPADEGRRFEAFTSALLERRVVDEASLTALHDAVSAPGLRAAFVSSLASHSPAMTGAWSVKLFSVELDHPDPSVRRAALQAMWLRQSELKADLAPFAPAVVGALRSDDAKTVEAARAILEALGPAAVRPLIQSLAGDGAKIVQIDVLRELGDPAAAPEVERILRGADTDDEAAQAAFALATFRRDEAKDALIAAIVAHGGAHARAVCAGGVLSLDEHDRPLLSPETRLALLEAAVAGAPGRTGFEHYDPTHGLSVAMVRELALACLASSAAADRLWGAQREQELLDAGAWDALLVAAQDGDAEVREAARKALRDIRAKELELSEFRSIGAERATRARIAKLIASEKEDDKRAGIAAIVATGIPGMVDELIRLAAEDFYPEVRDDARRALVALAKPPAAPPAPTPK